MDTKQLEEELKKCKLELSEFNVLLGSLKQINSTLDFHLVLDYLMEVAIKITACEASSVLLLEEDKLCFVAASGKKSGKIKKIYLDRNEGIAGWVIKNGKPEIINDVSKDKRFSEKADTSSGFTTRSVLAVPLDIEGKIIGVVEAVNKKNDKGFDKNDLKLLASLAAFAAMSINKAKLYADLNELFISTVSAIANTIEAKDKYTIGHSERIRSFALMIAEELHLSEPELKNLEIASLLHDVGKIGISEAILCKTGKLTPEEYEEMKKHASLGAQILSSIKQLEPVIPVVEHHQEHYNGNGYPQGLKGDSIPLLARIISVADAFDAMTSDRPYRQALSEQEAFIELKKESDMQFDPECVAAFIRGYEKNFGRK